MEKDSFELATEITIAAMSGSQHSLLSSKDQVAQFFETIYRKIEALKDEEIQNNPL